MERPILILPEPSTAERGSAGGGGAENIEIPSHMRQRERLAPQITRLENIYTADQAYLQANPDGAMPEHVLVLETIGAVEDFMVAVRHTTGLEWLGEFDEEDIPPDDDFYRTRKDGEKRDDDIVLKGRLYLVMTDHAALNQILSLWKRYSSNKDYKFPRGLTKWRDVFKKLRNIRTWGIEDRLRETGVIEDWQHRLQEKEKRVRFEIEIWFRQNKVAREQREGEIRKLITARKGRVVDFVTIEEICYHAVLAELPIKEIRAIVENAEASGDLVKCEQIMFFRPTGQCFIGLVEGETSSAEARSSSPMPQREPVVAVLDGLPLENHRLLQGRLIVDDPDDWQSEYQAQYRKHGTAMASLVVHGELDARGPAISRPVYVRPIMRPNMQTWPGSKEEIPEDVLPVDLVHRAVKRMFDGDGTEAASAPTVKIINLSVGDKARPYDNMLSPWARLLDWLSVQYQVLFVVSAGNCDTDIELDVSRNELDSLSAQDKRQRVIAALARSVRNRRILSPSESINVLTVGALHKDLSTPQSGSRLIDPYNDELPSPINGIGLGYRRSIKPDILMDGGRQLFDERLGNTHPNAILQARNISIAPGQQVATPGQSGDLSQVCYARGTSNAAALTTRLAAQYYDLLLELRELDTQEMLRENCIPAILKAMVVHGASWGDTGDVFRDLLRTDQNSRAIKDIVARFLGYGAVDPFLLTGCTGQRATLLGCGSLSDGDAHIYSIPLPSRLNARPDWRRLTVTLAWLSPIEPANRKYRKAHLWFDPPTSELRIDRYNVDGRTAKRGTVQHEILEGDKAAVFEENGQLQIKVNCRADAKAFRDEVPYGLVVSLQVAEDVDIPIYQQIRDRIKAGIRPSSF
ncbi:MAG: S8 family peptidase [Pirellulales bacterium]|nr:S8 family peptidase [Pirellulales bacterium]